MKRIWLCLGIAVAILLLTGYSTYQVRTFADEVTAQLDTAVQALEQDDLPCAHQQFWKALPSVKPCAEAACCICAPKIFWNWKLVLGLPPTT